MSVVPSFTLLDDGTRILGEPFSRQTRINGYLAAIPHVLLTPDGLLSLTPNYRWNGANGPVSQDDAAIMGSLVHDPLYELIAAGELPKSERKAADKELRRVMKDYRANAFRRWYFYVAVRLFGRADG